MASQNQKIKLTGKWTAFVFLFICVSAPTVVFAGGADSLFDFTSDVRLFTAYAMMNATGGAGEWRHAGMDSIRSELRADLAGRLDATFRNKIRKFNESHGRILEAYEYVLLTSGPPAFRVSYNPRTTGFSEESVKSDAGFAEILAEFYVKADIPQLWEKYRPIIQAENEKYRPFAAMALEDIISYCRLDTDYFARSTRRIHFQYMPLLPYFTSLTARVNGEIYIIVGPQEDKPDKSIFYYDLLQRVAWPLARKYSVDVGRLSSLFDVVRSKVNVKRGSWNGLVTDCVAEALDIRLEEKLYNLDSTAVSEALATEYKFGFILCPSIYGDLQRYERTQMTFGEYYPEIIRNVNAAEEKEHWEEYWGKSRD